jgi:hypothetical protein
VAATAEAAAAAAAAWEGVRGKADERARAMHTVAYDAKFICLTSSFFLSLFHRKLKADATDLMVAVCLKRIQ